jgi:hypothetical protein
VFKVDSLCLLWGKCTLVQALRLCTERTAHRGSRGISLPFHDHSTRRGEGQRHAPAALYPRERPGTYCTGDWVGPRAGLDRCGKSRPHRDSIPGPSSPEPVAIPTELPASLLLWETNWILCLTAVLWFGHLVAGVSVGRPEFHPEPIHVRFVLDEVALGLVIPRVLRFSPVVIIPPLLHIRS